MARRLCLITGASAGIGAAFARVYAARGYALALTARRADRLEALAGEIEGRTGERPIIIPADLAQPGAVDAVLEAVADAGGQVDALVNNAGYGLPGIYRSTSWADQAAFLQVMATVPAELAHKVLPGMTDRRFGRIINVASLAGLTPGSAGHTLYSAVKSFLIKFSQSLHLETRGSGVEVCAVCPGFTFSEFHDVNGTRGMVSKMPQWMWQTAEEVAEAGFDACEAGRPVFVPGGPNKAIAALSKLLPDDAALALMKNQGKRFRKVE